MKNYKIWRRPHGYFGGGILEPLIFPTITTRTGDADIDKIQGAGISNSQQYKMAGNSIIVDTLYYIIRKLFVDKGCEQEGHQQSLF